MKKTNEITPEVIKRRMMQAEEMNQIWEKSPEKIRGYLEGFSAAVVVFAGMQESPEPRKTG
ncbi:MAG: hypothetical protein LBQ71_03320 [Hungatella sp.]|jgi:hypothetical protein|nr:hypothetical protein [Hungatella sp.]